MGNVFLAGVLGMFAVTLAVGFAAPPKDVRPLGDDTINFVNNFKMPFKPNERKLEQPASQKSSLSSGNQVITVTERDIGNDGNRRLIIDGSGNHVVNGDLNDGLTLRGSVTLTVHGSVQNGIAVSGSSRLTVDRNVEGGADVGGSNNASVGGNVRGGITLTGSRTMNVGGDVYGDINAGGSSRLTVQGSHQGGSVTISGSAQVHILNNTVP